MCPAATYLRRRLADLLELMLGFLPMRNGLREHPLLGQSRTKDMWPSMQWTTQNLWLIRF